MTGAAKQKKKQPHTITQNVSTLEPMRPFCMALLDYFNGDTSTTKIIHREDGYKADLPIHFFFRELSEFLPIEHAALDLCRGRILDIGAGAGPHSLVLQERGFSVYAIDISPIAVKIMQRRGVKEAYCSNIFSFKGEEGSFDTILIMGRSIGMVGSLNGLNTFLRKLRRFLKPKGQVILNSLDVRQTDNPIHLTYHEANRQAGRYIGEIRMCFEYKQWKGPFFYWLHVDAQTLTEFVAEAGFSCQIVRQEESGNYLAKLSLLK